MEILATIKKIQYKIQLAETLKKVSWSEFDINESPTSCIVSNSISSFAVSKWVSPKRTRSYPYERVYNTLNISKKITIIPIIKDEGAAGDRDFIQWDTVSLMSLLDVYVIFAYYESAEKIGNKITNQNFDNEYVKAKIEDIQSFYSSALHWNLNELDQNFDVLLSKVISCYESIEKRTGVKLHDLEGVRRFQKRISNDVNSFKAFSRGKAQKAQEREIVTFQPKEALSTQTKAKLTLQNYLGGQYFLTVDEIIFNDDYLFLIEGKHTKNALLPSKSDIKDGLLKMILYTNLEEVEANNQVFLPQPVLKLTSVELKGSLSSNADETIIIQFYEDNGFNGNQKNLVNQLFQEAKINGFQVVIEHAK